MNNFGNYIHQIKKSNRKLFAAKKISLSPQILEHELERAYNQGYADSMKAEENKSIFEKVFGKSLFSMTENYIMAQSIIDEDEKAASKK